MVNFYWRFIFHAARTQASLHELFKDSKRNDKSPVPWNDILTHSFETCKQVETLAYHAPLLTADLKY